MYISKDEYILLKKIKKNDGISVKNEISDILLEKGFIKHKSSKLNYDGSWDRSPEMALTNEGIIAYENYEDQKATNFRSWVAIFISILSLLISAVSLYNSIF